ncbi:MAG TPA: ATP-dependent Clp protease adaptor ClpS [Phycisphaerales bacterium]|nr:ATP-dependent Clp protease adaptor ClpS [Phycisphaerales bacterium]
MQPSHITNTWDAGPDDDTPTGGNPPEQGGPGTGTKVRPEVGADERTEHLTPWNVVLIDDDDHTYEYVMKMLNRLFGHPFERAFAIAHTVDSQGRAVCQTTHKELAELKVQQIRSFGPDPLMATSTRSMLAVIEPAETGGDDSEDDSRP